MVMKEADEELALFLETRRSDKNDGRGFKSFGSPMSKTLSMDRKMGPEELLNLGHDKNDLLWLLSPPGSPLLTTRKKEENGHLTTKILSSSDRPAVIASMVENVQPDVAPKKPTESKKSSLPCQSKSSSNSCKRSSSLRPLSPANRRASVTTARPMVAVTSKPSRSITPSKVAARVSSSKPVEASFPRSSTPNRFTAARSSTPTRRAPSPIPKTLSKQSVPNTQSSIQSITKRVVAPKGQARSSSATKSRVAVSKTAMPPSNTDPTSEGRPSKHSGNATSSTDSRSPKLSLPRRPVSTSRIRPSAPASDKSFPPIKSRRPSNENDDVNPVLVGTKMVERIVNMRKLPPPTQDAHQWLHEKHPGKQSLQMASSGFGRSLSNKSLDMAMRHMDITGSKPGKLNRLRTGPLKSNNTTGVSDSPLATSSNASSNLLSLKSNSASLDGSETKENDIDTEKVCHVVVHGR